MLKKSIFTLFAFIIISSNVFAACSLNALLINQDPYPAVPGDYVEVVFQVSGVQNPDCKWAVFGLVLAYPFSADEETDRTLPASTYVSDYKNAWMLPYKLRIDNNALDGKSKIEVRYSPGTERNWGYYLTKKFNITIEDVKVNFEVSVKDYDKATNTLTFEILNIGKHDVEALTIDIPEQQNIAIRKSSRVIVGSLDSNEETTFEFDAVPNKGEIKLNIAYTDAINKRRTLEKIVFFNPDYFPEEEKSYTFYYILGIIVVAIILYFVFRKKKRKI